jgi:ATP-dependent Clp protease ATP-binding subunit ClpA
MTRAKVVGVFERLTDGARRVVVLAREEARTLNHNYIGTEHILLGLIHEGDGVAAGALESLGVSPEGVRQQVEEIIGRGQQAPSGHIPFTPRAKKALELSQREALRLGDNCIGTEHILLGLIREGDGVAAQVLVRLGAGLDQIEQQVTGRVTGEQTEAFFVQRARSRDLRLTEIENTLASIVSRLDAIERHLGMNDTPAEPGGVPDTARAQSNDSAMAPGDLEPAADHEEHPPASAAGP